MAWAIQQPAVDRYVIYGGVKFDWSQLPLEELRRHRDDVNTIIYDKERAQ